MGFNSGFKGLIHLSKFLFHYIATVLQTYSVTQFMVFT